MIWMSGVTNDDIEQRLIDAGIGIMSSQNIGYSPERIGRFPHVGLDNGCFGEGNWEERKWINWLARQSRHNCRFAVGPDVYPDAQLSLERGLEYAPIIRDMGFPAAIVAQGWIDPPWQEFDCLMIGGPQLKDNPRGEWKESDEAAELCRLARNHGLWVHYGRVNDEYRYALAERNGAHSADGTMLAFGPDANIGRVIRMVQRRNCRPPLPLRRYETPSHPNHRYADV